MTRLVKSVLKSLSEDRYAVTTHARNRLDLRGITEWQVVDGSLGGRVAAEHPANRPHPRVELAFELADGSPCKAVWAFSSGTALLVTVHFL